MKSILPALVLVSSASAFQSPVAPLKQHHVTAPFTTTSTQLSMNNDNNNNNDESSSRRALLQSSLLSTLSLMTVASPAMAEDSSMYAPSFVQTYQDFIPVDGGAWQYKDVTPAPASMASVQVEPGDRVVYDWSGYTIGYFGRPFEAKGGPQGGAFDKDLDYFRTIIGSHTVVPALEQAFLTMKPGMVRQVVVPYGNLSYPPNDLKHDEVGPKPTTFSGQRALNFVLENPRVDRTLLLNVKLIRVDKADGKGGFIRGESIKLAK